MKIAIIGAGVSGLSTAYYLKKEIPSAEIIIYETAPEVGGNANTFSIDLPDGRGGIINRWVDMGVNDFNLGTYRPLRELWKELNLMNQNKPCPANTNPNNKYFSALINAESFAAPGPDNKYTYSYMVKKDGKLYKPQDSPANLDDLASNIERFKNELAKWYKHYSSEGVNPITVGEWMKSFADKGQPFKEEFIEKNLYPRINGMYFSLEERDPDGSIPPAAIPLWMVAHYYILQEAYGHSPRAAVCPRQYFVKGSQRWLVEVLKKNLQTKGVKIWTGQPNYNYSKEGNQMVISYGSNKAYYDKVIFATHADTTLAMLKDNFSSDPLVQELKNFKFSTCDIYAHQDDSFLGPRKGDFPETYNIHIYDYKKPGAVKFPYSITYIVNMHQNDKAAGISNPDFYLSVNPQWKLNKDKILKQTATKQLAFATMKHCKLDRAAMYAQIKINDTQLMLKGERSFYFAGSFAIGAGLHMECIILAQELAKKIAKPYDYVSDQGYNFNGGERHFAPQYILDAITRVVEKDSE